MKKLIITLVVLAILVAGTIVGVKIYKNHRKNSNPVKCTNVAILNTGYWEYGDTLDGTISEAGDQKVYLDLYSIVAEVNVEPGQHVNVGDKLLTYDMTGQELQIEKMKAQLEVYKTDLLVAERELEKLKNMTPLEDLTTEEPTTEATTELTTTEATTEQTTEKGTPGDADKIFKEHPDWVMYPDGSFGPPPGNNDNMDPNGDIDPNGNMDPNGNIDPNGNNDPGNSDDPFDPDDPNNQLEPIYDRETLKELIRSKEDSIKNQKNSIEIYEIKIQKQEKKLEEGYVFAQTNGIVRTVDLSEEAITTGQPVIVVSSNTGYKTDVYINEWKLDKVNIGDPVTIYSYESGNSYTGKVASIEKTPTEQYGYYGGATASTYPMTIIIDEPCDDLNPGYWVEVTMGDGGGASKFDPYANNDKIYLPLPYVREENGNSYVMVNDNGRLKKRFVKTGKTVYNYAIEIKSGLSMEDYIAFPYGKDVAEGKKCINVEGYADMDY